MSLRLNASAIAEAALRRIGTTSWNDAGSDGTKLRLAIEALDRIVAELAGTERLWWLVPRTKTVSLIAAQQEYDLSGVLDPDIEFALRAGLVTSTGHIEPLCLYRRIEWDAIDDRDTRTGTPEGLLIERSPSATMLVYPIPTTTWTVRLTAQTVAPDLTQSNGTIDHGFPEAWQRYLELATAADIGAGPVEMLPEGEISRLLKQAEEAKSRLLARNRRENVERPRFTAYRDF